jgi:hypothetical protein
MGASVRQRLLNCAREQNRPFQELLQYFAMERFLYRLARSEVADMFVLKGALLLTAWRAPLARPVVIAEKLEALTALGLLNSRLKDYYDIAVLSRLYSFEGKTLSQAVRATFQHRGTAIQSEPVGLSDVFHNDPARMIQWRAFLRRSRFQEEPLDF